MVKLLLFPFALILAFASAQADLSAPVPHATEFPVGSTTTQSSIVSSTTQSSIVSSTVPTPSTRETALNFTSWASTEPGSNMKTEAIYEEVELSGNVSRAQQNHVIENVIYGAVIPRQA
ncbi:uncharacterized protein [Palaemon carinicauda]|uniref:uncharacterized protein n=1 Tax=Palaemon carinicauda TaxID=392227 RepID=UPI0035B5D179